MTKLFHGTDQVFSAGQTINATGRTPAYPHVCTALDLHRLPGLPSRIQCVFATDSILAASSFINAKAAAGHVYEVTMPSFHKAPFRIIHEIHTRINATQAYNGLIAEYWQPTVNWFLWECFGTEFTVVKEVQMASVYDVGIFQGLYDIRDTPLVKGF